VTAMIDYRIRRRSVCPAWIILFLFICAGLAGAGEYYQYTDESGAIVFTDDYASIPENQRKNSKKFEGSSSSSTKTEQIKAADRFVEEEADKLAAEANLLKQTKAALDARYAEIQNERKQILEQSEQFIKRKGVKAYNQAVRAFNENSREFQKDQDVYFDLVDSYNQRLKALEQQQSE
jgi:hypothetical protein